MARANRKCIVDLKGERSLFKVCILRYIVLTIQKVCIGSTLYKYFEDVVVNTLLHCQNEC